MQNGPIPELLLLASCDGGYGNTGCDQSAEPASEGKRLIEVIGRVSRAEQVVELALGTEFGSNEQLDRLESQTAQIIRLIEDSD